MSSLKCKPLRKAVLIASPGRDRAFLHGVEKDIQAMKSFLHSPRGGRWMDDEVIVLHNPNSSRLIQEVHSICADYCFIYYAGHGIETVPGQRKILLSNGAFEDLFLLNKCPRQLLIIDACRTLFRPGIGAIPDEEGSFPFDGFYPEREAFDNYILNSPLGKVIIHATQRNGAAFEFGSGGCFTQHFLYCAKAINYTQLYEPIGIKKILSQTASLLESSGIFQEPRIVYNKGNLKVPFALALGARVAPAPPIVSHQLRRRHEHSKEDFSGLIAAGLLLFAAAAIAD